jgi:hypothetical membrane protein
MISCRFRQLFPKSLSPVMISRKVIVLSGAFACFAGCIGDFLSLFILGPEYPGYSQLYNTMSSLGSSESPVSNIISAWWVILGILMILFAFGFRAAFSPGDKYARIVFWLLLLYGLGEGLGSGLFKADRVSGSYTTSFIVHDVLGSAGVFAILVLPLIVQKIKPFFSSPGFIRFSWITLIVGTLFLILFSFRFIKNGNNVIADYKGLWQRLFILVYYIYLVTIAFRMVRKKPG